MNLSMMKQNRKKTVEKKNRRERKVLIINKCSLRTLDKLSLLCG